MVDTYEATDRANTAVIASAASSAVTWLQPAPSALTA